jgi:hypothetical protein
VSHAGHSLALVALAAMAIVIFWFMRATLDAGPYAAAHPGRGGRHRHRRLLIFGVRFLPGLLPELFGLAGV